MGRQDRRTRVAAVIAAASALLVVGCSSKDDADSTSSTSTTSVTSTTAGSSTESSVPTTGMGSGDDDPWRRDAQSFRGQEGTEQTIDCPAGGAADSVWGTGTYTDDSSICTAAVQSGLITFEDGGEVTILIGPAEQSFDGGIANDVESEDYGPWQGSFTFPDAPPGSVTFTTAASSWTRNLADKATDLGSQVTVVCSKSGKAGSVWGTGTYTTDSSVCTAAVHAGLITFEDGGSVVAEITPGADSYTGSNANGVKTSDYGKYASSFTFPADVNDD